MKQRIIRASRLLLAAVLCALLSCGACAGQLLIPGGQAVGIELFGRGLLVTEVEESSCAARAGIRRGDRIIALNGADVTSAQQLLDALEPRRPAVLQVLRGGREAEFLVEPEGGEGGCRLGVWLRDHIAGIGTVTFIDPVTGAYGALGHGVNEPGGGALLPIRTGCIVRARVAEVRRGEQGAPGELHGVFDELAELGTVDRNTEFGIFGTFAGVPEGGAVAAADSGEVRTGAAEILSTVDGESVQAFTVEIEKIDSRAKNGRDLRIRVTDEALLERTGGIVQGMSGSPILQNGKLVGAVTHVLVNDPTRGYGILIEHMLESGLDLDEAA